MGPFPGYAENREPMLDVIRMHRDAMRGIKPDHVQAELLLGAQSAGTPRWNWARSTASRTRR